MGDARFAKNLQFADDIDLLRGTEAELQKHTERLEKTVVGYYGTEISSKIIIKPNAIYINRAIYIKWKTEELHQFKYL